jgi:adenine-specific DNA-methyltransferase
VTTRIEYTVAECPSTRYQGSKRKLIPWIYNSLEDVDFKTALDLFGGSGSVSHLFKKMGKSVTYNDYLKFNYYIGVAIIENSCVKLSKADIDFLLEDRMPRHGTFVEDTFDGMYYTKEENRWIDGLVSNIRSLRDRYSGQNLKYKTALAYYALFQSCLAKRPFNMFHRRNLYLREANVYRSFGNKTTWDTPFEVLFQRFAVEINSHVFSNGRQNMAMNENAFHIDNNNYDLVYIDAPYFSPNRAYVESDYCRMYHFLEGLANYNVWGNMIDYNSLTLHLKDGNSGWPKKRELLTTFDNLFQRFAQSIIVVSYKSSGIPTEDQLVSICRQYKSTVTVNRLPYHYALNKSNGNQNENSELLLIGR